MQSSVCTGKKKRIQNVRFEDFHLRDQVQRTTHEWNRNRLKELTANWVTKFKHFWIMVSTFEQGWNAKKAWLLHTVMHNKRIELDVQFVNQTRVPSEEQRTWEAERWPPKSMLGRSRPPVQSKREGEMLERMGMELGQEIGRVVFPLTSSRTMISPDTPLRDYYWETRNEIKTVNRALAFSTRKSSVVWCSVCVVSCVCRVVCPLPAHVFKT